MLNPNKRESILQWFNCISIGKGVQALKEFASGIVFYQIIISLSPGNRKQNLKPIEFADDECKNSSEEVSNHKELKEHPVYQNDANEHTTTAPDGILETTTSLADTKSKPSDEIEKTSDDNVGEVIQNGPTENVNSIDDLSHENVKASLDSVNESDVKSTTVLEKKAHELSNGSCPMEVSFEDKFLKPADVNHVENNSTTENNFINQHDALVSSLPEENSRTESFENAVNDDADENETTLPEIDERYATIRTFIDGMLSLKSEELVNYEECSKGNEFEIAKVAVLFLCAWLQSYLLTDNLIYENTICHLHLEIQEEIKECLELFLKEKSTPVKRREFHDVLIRTVRPRSSPRWSTPVSVTPQATKTKQTRKSRSRKNVQIIEDITIESSPIKSFLQSPDVRHITPKTKQAVIQDAVSRKNKEISELFESLEEERYKNKDLEEKIENLNFQLSQLKAEKTKMKTNHNEEIKLLDEDKEILLKEKKSLEGKNKRLKQKIEQLQEDLKFLKAESHQSSEKSTNTVSITTGTSTETIIKTSTGTEAPNWTTTGTVTDTSDASRVITLEFYLKRKEEKIKELQDKISIYKIMENEFETLKNICLTHLEDNIELQQALLSQQFGTGRCKIHDFSIRNELGKDYLDLQKYSEERDNEYRMYKEDMETKYTELQKMLKDLKKSEIDWKAKFRKADKERENAMKISDKRLQSLERTISKLKSQIEVYKNTLNSHKELNCEASLVGDTGTNISKKNSADKDNSATLWLAFTSNSSGNNDEVPNSRMDQGSKKNESLSSYTLLCDTRASLKRKSLKLNDLSQEKLSSSNVPCVDSYSVVESTNGRPQCSVNEFNEIKSCVMNVFRAIESSNIKTDVLPSNIEDYEKNFVSVQDLIHALVLFCKIIQEDFNAFPQSSAVEKNINDDEVQNNRENSNSLCEVEQHSPVREQLIGKPLEVTTEPSCSQELELPLQKSLDLSAKVSSLTLQLKKRKNKYESEIRNLQELLTKAEDINGKSYQKYLKIEEENKTLKKRIKELEQNIVGNTKKSIKMEKSCESCLKKSEKLNLYRSDRSRLMKTLETVKSTAKTHEQKILKLETEYQKSLNTNKKLKEEVAILKKWNHGNFATPLYEAAERLNKTVGQELAIETEDDWEENPESINEIMDSAIEDDRSCDTFPVRSYHENKSFKQLSAFCFPEDEDDIPNESSISEANPKYRLHELQWRNSLYLPHMQSTYPLELDNTPTASKYTKAPSPVSAQSSRKKSKSVQSSSERHRSKQPVVEEQSSEKKHSKRPIQNSMTNISKPSTSKGWIVGSSSEDDRHSAKRRKVVQPVVLSSHCGRASRSIQRTPKQNSSTRKMFKTPQSFFRLMNQRRRQR